MSDYADVPVVLVGDSPAAVEGGYLVDLEGFGAHLVAELVEVVDERARRVGVLGVVRSLLLHDVEGRAQELAAADGRFE